MPIAVATASPKKGEKDSTRISNEHQYFRFGAVRATVDHRKATGVIKKMGFQEGRNSNKSFQNIRKCKYFSAQMDRMNERECEEKKIKYLNDKMSCIIILAESIMSACLNRNFI